MTLLKRALSSEEIKDLASRGPDAPGLKVEKLSVSAESRRKDVVLPTTGK